MIYYSNNELEMFRLCKHLMKVILPGDIIYLHGNIGVGKTTLVRGVLRGLGFHGNVKSPTYTFVETYSLNHLRIHHFDLYRLAGAEELEWIGIREYFQDNYSVVLIEWPEKGTGFLPEPTKRIFIDYHGRGRKITIFDN